MTTSDLSDNEFTLVANRDSNGHASGSFFMDDGIKSSQGSAFYEFQLSANSFKKWQMDDSTQIPHTLSSLIIANADDLKDSDFACYTSNVDHSVTQLTVTPSTSEDVPNFLTISAESGIDMTILKDIHYGNSATDLNICDVKSQYYKVSGDAVDITGKN